MQTLRSMQQEAQVLDAIEPRKVDIRLPGKGNSNSHGARPVHQKIITLIKWIRTRRLSIKNSLSGFQAVDGVQTLRSMQQEAQVLSTLNPEPCTLHPEPCTLHPQPSTLNPQLSTLNPQPSTLHPAP